MRIADCDRTHAAAILEIFNHAIAHTAAVWDYVARTPEWMAEWFDAKQASGYPVIGAFDDDGALIGFATYGSFRGRPGYKYSVEQSVYVADGRRGRGVGKALVRAILERARAQDYHTVIAGIEASNEGSKVLHRELGFEPCGTVREAGWKFGRWLDLELWQIVLDTPAAPIDG